MSTRTTEVIQNDFAHVNDNLEPQVSAAPQNSDTQGQLTFTPKPFPMQMPPAVNNEIAIPSSPKTLTKLDSDLIWSIDCDGCSMAKLTSGEADEEMIQCDGCDKWAHVWCMQKSHGLSEGWVEPSFEWKCPTCKDQEVWTDER